MISCSYDSRKSCSNSPAIGFDMCIPHLQTPRGLSHARERIDSGQMFTYADLQAEIRARTEAPLKDYHQTALEKMVGALEEAEEWSRVCRERLYALDPNDWRYTDRHGQEQVRGEVKAYEAAKAEVAKIAERAAKMSIQEKVVSLGRAQTELVIRLAMGTIEDLGLDASTFDKARAILLERFRREAHLSAKHEAQVTAELESANAQKAIL